MKEINCYRGTRHNLGFRVVRELADRLDVRVDRVECNALVGATDRLLLAMPQTFMNRSGYAARCLTERHEIEADNALVVYDDVELPLGRLRLRSGGGPGGHRADERPEVERLVGRAADACQAWLELDIQAAMNRFNG